MTQEAAPRAGSPHGTVFVSYAHADQARASELVAALEAACYEVWWDALIEGGAVFAHSIAAALERCDAVVVLWSGASVESDWVRDEAAVGRDARKLVPVTLDGTMPPLGFRQYHALDFSRWRAEGVGRAGHDAAVLALQRGIERARSGDARAPGDTPPGTGTVPVFARRRLLLAAAASALLGSGGLFTWRFGLPVRAAAERNSVAVLPFANLGGDPAQSWFSDGVCEEVRATLARNASFRVLAQTSSNRYRDRSGDAVSIAGELGVAFLLEGSVRRAGSELRVVASLVDGATGFSRWAHEFQGALDRVFDVQHDIALAVTAALAAELGPALGGDAGGGRDAGTAFVSRGLAQEVGGTRDVRAYDAYLRGRARYDTAGDERGERAALAQFDAALALDPRFAAAHAARSRSLTAIASQYAVPAAQPALYGAAIASARRAITLAPALAAASSMLGLALFQGRLDARAARAPFAQSRRLGGGDATVLGRYALFAARVGDHAEALEAIRRAVGIDPLNAAIHHAHALVDYAARRYADVQAAVQRALKLDPDLPQARATLADATLQLGQLDAALQGYRAERFASFSLAGQAIVAWRQGNRADARRAMTELVARLGDVALYQQAQVRAQWGEHDAALACLERARMLGDSGLIYARGDPLLDPLRAQPRFLVLLRSVGFD